MNLVWDKKRIAEVKGLWDKGLSLKDMAFELKLTIPTVRMALERHYADRTPRRSNVVSKYAPETIALLKRYYDEGASMESIGLSLGMSVSAVCGALYKHYPERVLRNAPLAVVDSDKFKTLLDDFSNGHTYAALCEKFGVKETSLRKRLERYSKEHPNHYAQLKAKREPIVRAKRSASFSHGRKPAAWLAVSNNNHRAWSPLDEAIRILQKYAPCYRSPCGKGIVYGTRLKTEQEIMAMAERKAA